MGGLTALLITLLSWHEARHFETPRFIAWRFFTFMACGIFWGLSAWDRREAVGCKKRSRTGNVVRFVVFIGLVVVLNFALWRIFPS